MGNVKPSSKMFLDIVGELRVLITKEGIKTGGKLPSERELAERLQAGRSTIREALRSLELLGLIETRRGEGTFLTDFRKHQLVEVLAEFIMQQPDSILDVRETRRIHEVAAIRSVCKNSGLRALPVWESLLTKLVIDREVLREDIIREMIVATENRLSLKIWFLLKQYSKVKFSEMTKEIEIEKVTNLLHGVLIGNELLALEAYLEWIEIVEEESRETRNDS
ncbi:FadR/GntR family transcriptional regulator [Sporosarcina sp. G11-34]|uniref:FadR/GntR family transcriptional regulator n=1 Tax=Sporosarcina sp. G11-34 TaxID=2849605 RepID=UPI0022A9A9E8|nr:GntR family transcriptional regulator [Sporosarcina sp. G11-34]MCZ2257986.1 GntR family transcriptional regulator [Sporosarcina sp. G11-34]